MGRDVLQRKQPKPALTGRVRAIFRSLGLSLFLWLTAVIFAAFAAYAFLNIRTTSRQWNQTILQGAQRFSELIQHSTHYSMLLNRKQDVHHIIRTIALAPGVEDVRIYDKHGVVIYSANESEIGRQVDLQAEACVSCHGHETPLRSVPAGSRSRLFAGRDGERVLGLINPIENAPECYNAPCHAHPPAQSVLGVLDVQMSMAEPDARLGAARRQAVTAAVLIALAAGLASAGFILHMVRRPVKQLIAGTRRISGGDLDTAIRVDSRNEMGQLATAFNTMTGELREARRTLTEWSGAVENKLQVKTEELTRAQRQVAHMDKMASLGRLAATVAHELNNPLEGILNYARLVDRTLADEPLEPERKAELDRYVNLIQKETARCGTIVRNMLLVSRKSGGTMAPHALGRIIERSVMLVRHHLEISGIRLETRLFEGNDELVCDADQIQQALVTLLVNAVEAMPDGGTIRLSADAMDDAVGIEVSDTGCGISEDALPHIFEPFFSTKTSANGAGLGLSVTFGIVQRHGGTIEVESKVNQGATIRIVLPRHPPPESDTAADEAAI
ncbi:MAG: hypothetical protein A2W00_08520 [Candidatus Eisenbacteria bacterium RBG_16_71_46]|nr:MAG: hypothetical protein A2W00_08520 [Candidatus Eisenbacteria bacterium RBG_16_71_46]OGF21888.1 MAG: hypothetical protein A2V63_04915 [Candidatus Eisenbacteria bacterium RBG_19FT_COMBO_70_11]